MNWCREKPSVPHLSPQTLTQVEQRAILRATAGNLRVHLIYSLALGTGLRMAEIVGLNVGDVYTTDGKPKNRLRVRAEIAKGGRAGDVFLPDSWVGNLRKFWGWKRRHGEGLQPGDPLFCSQGCRRRISPHRVQFAFRTWQIKAGFDRLYSFHSLRHTAVMEVCRRSRDLFRAQRFARHVSPLTTTNYTHPSDQELFQQIRGLDC
jgi:integrase/recombinase XerC